METTVHEKAYRGSEVVEALEKTPFYIAGCGAVGSNMIENLSRQGAKTLCAIDFDRVDGHNVGTQTFGRRDAGQVDILSHTLLITGCLAVLPDFRGAIVHALFAVSQYRLVSAEAAVTVPERMAQRF